MSSRNEMSGLKRLVLGGAVAGLSTLSGCVPLVAAGILQSHYDTQRKIEADRENAMLIANAQGNNGSYTLFIGSSFDDRNNDGCLDPRTDISNKGKINFCVGDSFIVGISQYDCIGKTFKVIMQNLNTNSIESEGYVPIQLRFSNPYIPGNFFSAGDFKMKCFLNETQIGEYSVNVRER